MLLGYNSVAGGKLKETGTINWTTPNSGATNETGFKALPGGQRAINTNYVNVNYKGVWWGGIGNSNSLITLSYDDDDLEIMYYLSRNLGASVRCLKD